MITFSSVSKQYGARSAHGTLAVTDVSLTIKSGDFFALLGPNGAGKTTLIKMLLDFIRPTSGTIMIDGISSCLPQSRNGIGYLPENIRIPAHLTGFQFLSRQAELAGISRDEATKQISEIIETVGMTGKERAKVKTYSKGMQQRIGLGAALLCGTKLLVLDEPVSGLDPIGIRDVRRIMENLKQKGITIILNSHLLSEVEKTCTTAAIINKGNIVLCGNIADIAKNGETLEDVFVRVIEAHHA